MSSKNDEGYQWVELLDPKSQRTMYVNLESGECCWEPPKNQAIKPLSSDQWWELFDVKAQRNYYYNSITRETVWQRPANGDIIPLANLQLLQQNMQQAANTSNQDIGMLRRSNSKVSSSTGNRRTQHRKLPTSILESSTRTGSDLDQPVRNETRDCSVLDEHALARRTSIDTMNLAVDQFNRLSSQNAASSYRPYGNQRVRDWLREAGVAWECAEDDAIQMPTTQPARDNADRKNSGCFSDRPTRRIHSLAQPNGAGSLPLTDQSSPTLLTPTVECMTIESNDSGPMLQRNPTEAIASRLTSGRNDATVAWNAEQQQQHRKSSELVAAQRDSLSASGPSNLSTDVGPLVSRKPEMTAALAVDRTEDARLSEGLLGEFDTTPQSNSVGLNVRNTYRENGVIANPCNGQHPLTSGDRTTHSVAPSANLDATGFGTRQRAFPRTNPTVSRPAISSGTGGKPSRFSATTLDRAATTTANYNVLGSNLGHARHSTGSSSSVQRNPTFNVIHFSSTDLRTAVPRLPNGADISSYQLEDTRDHPQLQLFVNPSCSDASLLPPLNEASVNASCDPDSAELPPIRINSRNIRISPNSASPQPSSSSTSSSSFSRASSGTALTNTDSDEGKPVVRSAPNQDTALGAFPLANSQMRRASLQPETKAIGLNPFQQPLPPLPDLVDGNIDLEQPPVPPPRSASTLGSNRLLVQQQLQPQSHCTSDFYRLAQGGLIARPDPYVLAQRPYAVFYPRYPQYVVQQQHMSHLMDGNLAGDGRTVSSLSRKDPARAHVIAPNHRRPPPFTYQTRPAYPMSDHSTIYYINPVDGLVHETTASYGSASVASHSMASNRLSSTSSPLLPSTGAELCSISSSANGPTGTTSPSTATTWISHSTAAWDLDNLHTDPGATLTSTENEPQLQPISSGSSVLPRSAEPLCCPATVVSINHGTIPTVTSTAAALQRSPSGGFIGPEEEEEELNESVWFSTPDRARAGPCVPLFTLVRPGHPHFVHFIAPFDWPRTLFKPDQDVISLMSWTKSTFSKRLLLSTEPNIKKQVADTFKIIQSFMGDRKARLSLPDYGSIIVHRALNTVGLRDEIFAQLCKQTTGNPDIKSLTNGWALICVCLHYFPPNSKFRDHLLAYLNSRAESAVSSVVFHSTQSLSKLPSSLETAAAIASGLAPIVSELKPIANGHGSFGLGARGGSTMGSTKSDLLLSDSCELADSELSTGRRQTAKNNVSRPFEFTVGLWDRPTAAHFARVAPRWFVRALNVGARKLLEAPSIEEICHVKDFILKPSIFGGTLAEMMRIQAYRFPHLRLPWIQIFLTEELLRLNGPTTEGIFRLSPDLDLVTEIRCQLEKLFEIFRVVHVCVLDPDGNQADEDDQQQQHPADCFRVLRPPPPGWSLSLREFETEPGPSESAKDDAANIRQSAPILGNYQALTGCFTWPLTPGRIRSPPAEYVLLTPTDQWPCSLATMASRLSTTTTAGSNCDPQVDPHLAAGLLKLWLREMADPLVPVELQPECLKAACEAELYESHHLNKSDGNAVEATVSDSNPIQLCCSLVRKIPPLERRSLLYLILLLQHLAKRENSSCSLMDARNLATVIAPNLMRSSSTNPRDLLENIRPQTLFVRLLITYLDVDAELQHVLSTERDEDFQSFTNTAAATVTQAANGIGPLPSAGGGGGGGRTASWLCAPVRVRLGPDNGLLPA